MNKNDLIEYYYSVSREFPQKKISEDSLRFKEYLFSESFQEPSYANNSELSKSFILEIKKEKTYNKNNWRNNQERNIAKESNVVKNNHDDTVAFFAGSGTNKRQVEEFVKGSKNIERNVEKEVNQEKFRAFISMDEKEDKSDSMVFESKINIGDISADEQKSKNYSEFYKNPDVSITNSKEIGRSQENLQNNMINGNFPNQMQNKVMLIPAFNPMIPMPIPNIKYEPVKIDNIFLFNQKTKIPNDLPLWYLHYPMPSQASTGIGPISSKRLYEMFGMNQVHGNTDFRPIDIFKFSFNNFNEFAKLKIINEEDWVMKVEDSLLLQYTELYTRSQKILTSEILKNEKVEIACNNKLREVVNVQHIPEKKEIIIEEKLNLIKKNKNSDANAQILKDNIHSDVLKDETLIFTQPILKSEINEFVSDSIIEEKEKTLFLNTEGGIKREVEEEDNGQWEVVKKTKKKQKANDESIYLIGNKPKDVIKKENKFNCKVDLISSEELVNQLRPKQKQKDSKPDFEAFSAIGNASENNDKNKQVNEGNKNKKKLKGKPQDLDIKLGFKI